MKLDEVVNKKILTEQEIESEIKAAEKEGRLVDFSNRIISSFFVVKDKIKQGLTFENSEIKGQFFLGEILIEGDLILKNTKVSGSVYLAKIKIGGNLDMEELRSEGAINLVGAEIGKDLRASRLRCKGFLSLARAQIGGNLDLGKVKIETMVTKFDRMAVRGDLILEGVKVFGNINVPGAQIDGLLDLDEVNAGNDLNLTGAVYKTLENEGMKITGQQVK